jgi:hypothetical protein
MAFDTTDIPKVYIIILNWNGKEETLVCLNSVKGISYTNFETIVVDNGSTDGSEEAIKAAFPEVAFIQAGENLGYAEGNNVGIRYAMDKGAAYVFILNNDTIVDTNVIAPLVNEAEKNPSAAIFGPKIYFFDRPDIINSAGGNIQYDTMERGQIGYGFKEDNKTYSSVTSVDWTTGAAFFIRVSTLKVVGLFDADYFLICEDLDLCSRIRKHGYDILFVPDSKVWHKVSTSFDGNFSPIYYYYFFRNSLMYVKKNIEGNRRRIYKQFLKQLLKDSCKFYSKLKEKDISGPDIETDYKKKGFYIILGIMHFFLGVKGKAPSWIFKKKNMPAKR